MLYFIQHDVILIDYNIITCKMKLLSLVNQPRFSERKLASLFNVRKSMIDI